MTYLWQSHLGRDARFDPAYHMKARTHVLSFFADPPGTTLDVGCGGGATGKALKEKFPGTRVLGIEVNSDAAQHARQWLDAVICAPVEDVDAARDFPGERFDTVLLLDVLEHMYDPWHALVNIGGWLEPGA